MKLKIFVVLLGLLGAALLNGLTGCGTDNVSHAGESYSVEKTARENSQNWPEGVKVALSVAETKDQSGQTVKVISAKVNGAGDIFGSRLEDTHLRLTKFSGGAYEGPHFTREDGTIWTMVKRSDINFRPFRKTVDGWESILPLEWACQDGRFAVSLVDDSKEQQVSFNLDITQNYLVAGNGVEKYIPAAHGPGVIIACQ